MPLTKKKANATRPNSVTCYPRYTYFSLKFSSIFHVPPEVLVFLCFSFQTFTNICDWLQKIPLEKCIFSFYNYCLIFLFSFLSGEERKLVFQCLQCFYFVPFFPLIVRCYNKKVLELTWMHNRKYWLVVKLQEGSRSWIWFCLNLFWSYGTNLGLVYCVLSLWQRVSWWFSWQKLCWYNDNYFSYL